MKQFILILLFLIGSLVLGIIFPIDPLYKDHYLSKEILDTATPFDVTINQELLKKLNPAYEQ